MVKEKKLTKQQLKKQKEVSVARQLKLEEILLKKEQEKMHREKINNEWEQSNKDYQELINESNSRIAYYERLIRHKKEEIKERL